MRPLTLKLALACALLSTVGAVGPAIASETDERALRRELSRAMRNSGPAAGAIVVDATSGRVLYRTRSEVARIPASVQKLATTGAAMLRLGAERRLETAALTNGEIDAAGMLVGDLFLRGGGDPTFGTRDFATRAYGTGSTVERLAAQLVDGAGLERVEGSVLGDELLFDTRRGGPDSNFAISRDIGVLGGLSFNRGFSRPDGSAYQAKPAAFAANRLALELKRRGVEISGKSSAARTPQDAKELAMIESPTLRVLARLTNRPSDNFFAEMLFKGLGARVGNGSHAGGAKVVDAELDAVGVRWRVSDGSGLSRANAVSPREVVDLLLAMRRRTALATPFSDSLAVAGRSGTLSGRMRGTAAQGRCRAKTGTLSDVSALAGTCATSTGGALAFAIMMNRAGVSAARRAQDRMAIAIARYRAAAPGSSATSRAR